MNLLNRRPAASTRTWIGVLASRLSRAHLAASAKEGDHCFDRGTPAMRAIALATIQHSVGAGASLRFATKALAYGRPAWTSANATKH